MEPTSKRQPKATKLKKPFPFSSTQREDPIVASSTVIKTTAHYSKWNTDHTHRTSKASADPLPRVNTHLQAKALSLSANADYSSPSLLKKNHNHNPRHHHHLQQQRHQVDMEKEQSKTEKEKDKVVIPRERDEPMMSSVSLQSARRKSFCDSPMELGDFFSTVGVKVIAADMPPFMQIHAVTCARKTFDGLEKFTSKTLALTLKKEFDGEYGPAWHCIVGTSFGSFVTHSVGGFLYFSLNHHKLYILLFKTTVQRAN